MHIKTILIFLAIASCLSPTLLMSATEQSLEKLIKFNAVLSAKGYSCRDSVEGRYLAKNQSYTVNTTLYEENTYTLVAAGNVHVKDIDIVVYDENYNAVIRDTDDDPNPVVLFSPKWSGKFHIKVTMYKGKGYSNLMTCWKKN